MGGGTLRMEGEGGACHPRQAPGLPTAGRGVVGPQGQAVSPDPPGPSGLYPPATVMIPTKVVTLGGAGRIKTRSGLDAGGRLRTIRASLSRT